MAFVSADSSRMKGVEQKTAKAFHSKHLKKNIRVDIYLPTNWQSVEKLPILWANDGQDMEAVGLAATLSAMWEKKKLTPFMVVAIHADSDRKHDYGTAHQADFKKRGDKAGNYTRFILEELAPDLLRQFKNVSLNGMGFMGFSLGGLSALDIVWNNPAAFEKVGVFSGSLWWRSKAYEDGYVQETDRIIHAYISKGPYKPGLKFWFEAGTLDETNDRDKDGIIDAIGDTLDLMKILKGLGYRDEDIRYTEVIGGHHNQATWGAIMPDFLLWAYGTQR